VVETSGGLPTINAGTTAIFQQNSATGNWSTISIIGGATGRSTLDFGDINDQDAGSIDYANGDNSMRFSTNATERMMINSAGRLGVGTTSPDNLLDVAGKVSFTYSAGDEMVIINDDIWQHANGNQDFGVGGDHFIMASLEGSGESAGIYGDGNTLTLWSPGDSNGGQPSAMLYILDEDRFDATNTNPYDNSALIAYLNTTGTWVASDKNRKEKIERISDVGDKLSTLNAYRYQFIRNEKEMAKGQAPEVGVGFMAQELEKVLPEAVQTNAFGEKFVNYSAVIPLLLEGFKEQQAENDSQKQRIDELERQIQELRALIER
jgi:hypothetical protein